jgi:transcriptional regulator with XRE-family HTH domain
MIGKKIKNLLLIKDMTTQELADLCGLEKYTIEAVIYGRSKKTIIIEKIAEVLGISSKFLLEGDLSILNYETKYSIESQNVDIDLFIKAVLLSNDVLKSKHYKVTKGMLLYYSSMAYDHIMTNKQNYEKTQGFIEGILENLKQ